jgi:hypothetical protein
MGLPYHRCYDVDAENLIPGEPVELVFDCYPTSWLFREETASESLSQAPTLRFTLLIWMKLILACIMIRIMHPALHCR